MSKPYRRPRSRVAAGALLVTPSLCIAQAEAVDVPMAGTLAPVVVTSTRTATELLDTPASVDVVEGADMRALRLGADLAEGLTGLPGVQLQDRNNDAQDLQIAIRGFGARSTFGVRGVQIYVDGIPATMPDGQGQTSNIDIATIDRVEVLRGPFSALYGNSSGGVIQVFTEDGERPPRVGFSLGGGSDNTWRYGVGASGAQETAAGVLDYRVGVNRYTTHGYRDHSAARRNLGNAKLGLQLDEHRRLTIIANHVDVTAQDPLGLTREQFDTDPRQARLAQQYNTRKTVRQTQGGLRYEHRVNADNELSAMLYYGRRHTRQFLSIPAAPQQSPLHAGGVIDLDRDYAGVDLRWSSELTLAGRAFTLIGGVAYDQLKEDRQGYLNYVDTPAGRTFGVMGALRRDESNRVRNLDPYLQASWNVAERWNVDAGVRWSNVRFDSDDHYIVGPNTDDSGDARYSRVLPMASVRFAATENVNLYAAFGRGFETPTFNEVSYRPDGQPGLNFGLRPATNTSLELGAKAAVGGGLATAAVFGVRTEDEIVTAINTGGRSTFQNAGRTRRHGVELAWDGGFGDHWQTRASYTWLDARYRDDVCAPAPCGQNPIRSGNRIPGIARHAVYAALDWMPPEGWRAGIDVRYMASIQVDDANTDAAPSYVVAGAGIGYLWRAGAWELNAFGRLDNLFDRKYAGSVIVNEGNGRFFESAPGRNWSAGVGASYAF